MPETLIVAKKQESGLSMVSAGLIAGGVALIAWSLVSKRGGLNPINPGEKLEGLASLSLSGPNPIQVRIGDPIQVLDPTVAYLGPGRDAYSFVQIRQMRNGIQVPVQASGVAGSHLGLATVLTTYHLIPPEQPQPPGCPQSALCAYIWPGPEPAPICGAPPEPGYADVWLEIYEKKNPNDFDGYASPTCNGRIPVARLVLLNKIFYV